MNKEDLRKRVEEVGLVPSIRTPSAEDALFAVEEVAHGGIPIIEVTMTIPGALDVIREIARTFSTRHSWGWNRSRRANGPPVHGRGGPLYQQSRVGHPHSPSRRRKSGTPDAVALSVGKELIPTRVHAPPQAGPHPRVDSSFCRNRQEHPRSRGRSPRPGLATPLETPHVSRP